MSKYDACFIKARQDWCNRIMDKIFILYPEFSRFKVVISNEHGYAQAELRLAENTVLISTHMMELITHTSQLILLIGHELGHSIYESHYHANQYQSCGVENHALIEDYKMCKKCEVSLRKEYSLLRQIEHNCDKFGHNLVTKLGYDPNEAINLWEKLADDTSLSIRHAWATHPTWDQRIQKLKAIQTHEKANEHNNIHKTDLFKIYEIS